MKKSIILILLFGMIIVGLTGCGKKTETKTKLDDIQVNPGNMTSTCKSVENGEDYNLTTITIVNYDANGYAINMKVEDKYIFLDGDQFEVFVEQTKNNTEDNQKIEGARFDYAIDENTRTIQTVFAYSVLTYSDDLKEDYNIRNMVKTAEKRNEKCEITGVNRESLGF